MFYVLLRIQQYVHETIFRVLSNWKQYYHGFFDLDRVYLWDQIKLNRRMLCSEVSGFDRRWFVIFIKKYHWKFRFIKIFNSVFQHMNRTHWMFSILLRKNWESNYSTEIVKILCLFCRYEFARNMETSNVLFSHHSFQILLLSVYTTHLFRFI